MIINLIDNTASFYVTTSYNDDLLTKMGYKDIKLPLKKIKYNDFPKLTMEQMPSHSFGSELYGGKYPCIKCKYWEECDRSLVPHDFYFEQKEEL